MLTTATSESRSIYVDQEFREKLSVLYQSLNKDVYNADNSFKKIAYAEFSDLWIKDESGNPSGTHKDRLALNVLELYLKWISIRGLNEDLPKFSLISAGNAAIAIGSILKENGLPNLKVLIDRRMDAQKIELLQSKGCDVFLTDLFSKSFSVEDILRLTKNQNGIDLTSYCNLSDLNKTYNHLAEKILARDPDVIISPYGTGGLFSAICNAVWERCEKLFSKVDIFESKPSFAPCSVIGVTSFKNSKADKIHASFSPFDNNNNRLSFFKSIGILERKSEICCIEDSFINEAIDVIRLNEIRCEPSGAAGLAYLIKYKNV